MAVTLRKYLNSKLKEKGLTVAQAKKNAGKYKSIAAAKKAGSLYYTNKDGKVMAAVYAEDLKKPLKPIKPKVRPGSGSIKVEVLVGSMTKSEVADAIKKGKNPMNLAKAAKKKKPVTNKKGKPMNLSGKSRGGMAKRKARR
tara:strand:- start:102 stop:524 length:423 start_codon:yes stop_codon:yes gene_type:complete